jgi:hypothetical protein
MEEHVVERDFFVVKDLMVPCFIGADFIQRTDIVIHLSVKNFWKEKPVTWNELCHQAFKNLKKAIIQEVVLVGIDYSKPIKLTCDASEIGLRAALLQVTNDGNRPISFASKLLKSERHAHIYEKEIFPIIWEYKKLKKFLETQRFTIQKENKAVRYFHNIKGKKSKLMRWSIEIASWDAELIWRPGIENVEADVYSSNPVLPTENEIYLNMDKEEVQYCPVFSIFRQLPWREKLRENQPKDIELRELIEKLQSTADDLYKMDEGILMKKEIFNRKIYEDVVGEDEDIESEELSVICAALGLSLDRSGTGRIGKTKTPNQGVSLAVRTRKSGHKANNSGIDHSRDAIDQGQTTGLKGKPSGRKTRRKVSERLVRAKERFYVPVIPKSLVHEIIHVYHDTPRVGHQGVNKTMDLIKRSCFGNGIRRIYGSMSRLA